MAFGVHSEVGRLRRVMVHRPGLGIADSPANAEDLLFDDVIWVDRAEQEHDAFMQVMRDRGVEVFHAEELLAEALEQPEARRWALDHILNERMVGHSGARRAADLMETMSPVDWADFLIGGITKADLAQELPGLLFQAADPTSMLVPPLPNFMFQRDPSCWIYGGVTLNPMAKPARKPETMIVEAIYRFHPMFAADGGVKVWIGGVGEDWGRVTIEGGDVEVIGNGAVMIGMGERTRPRPSLLAKRLFADRVPASSWPSTCRLTQLHASRHGHDAWSVGTR
jgi:arginine deiminase